VLAVVRHLEEIWGDLRYAIRSLSRTPGVTIAAIFALALGIGANTALYSTLSVVLLRPLPFLEADRIVMIWTEDNQRGSSHNEVSIGEWSDLRQQTRAFETLAAARAGSAVLGPEQPEEILGVRVTPDFFRLLGVGPLLGRPLDQVDDIPTPRAPNSGSVQTGRTVVISHSLWKRRFGSDSAIIGHEIQMSGRPVTVVGE
jgi:putative ABC transport system permease protein